MANNTKRRAEGTFLLPLLLFLLCLSILITLGMGSVSLSFEETARVMAQRLFGLSPGDVTPSTTADLIVWDIRLPRVLVASIGGAILALSGILMQTLTRNPVAEPYVLGLSSGASAGAVMVILFGSSLALHGYAVPLGAFGGAILSLMMVMVLAGHRPTALRLILIGMGVSAFFSALTTFAISEAQNDAQLRSAVFWMLGSFSSAQWRDVVPLLVVLTAATGSALCLVKELDALLLGDQTAASLGVALRPIKSLVVFLSALVVALLVSRSGVIGFVGLIVPHTARCLVGVGHRKLMPLSMVLGALFMLWTDTLARTIYSPEELPVGIVTSLLGAPLFIWIVHRNYSFGGQP